MGSFQNNITECLQQRCGPMLHSNLCKGLTTFSQEHKTHITHWLSDWLTYDFSCTWRYSKDVRWLLCAAFHWHFELREENKFQTNKQLRYSPWVSPCWHTCMKIASYIVQRWGTKRLIVGGVHCVAFWELATKGHWSLPFGPPHKSPTFQHSKQLSHAIKQTLCLDNTSMSTATCLVQHFGLFVTDVKNRDFSAVCI